MTTTVTGQRKVARFPEPTGIEDPNIRSWGNSLVRELNLALNDKAIPAPQTVEVNRVLKATGQNVYAWISSDNPVSSGSADANKFLKTTAANVFTWASVVDVDKVSSGSGDANKYFKTTGANAYTWSSVVDVQRVSSGSADANKFFKTTGAQAFTWTSITDVSAANQAEMEAATSTAKAKFVNPHAVQYSPYAAKGGLVCDVSARICSLFGNVVSVGRLGRGGFRFYFSPEFSTKSNIYVDPRAIMTSVPSAAGALKNAQATSVTTSTADIFIFAGPSAADENNEKITLRAYGDI